MNLTFVRSLLFHYDCNGSHPQNPVSISWVRLPADHEEQLEAGATAAEAVSAGAVAINIPQHQITLQNIDLPANFHIEAEVNHWNLIFA